VCGICHASILDQEWEADHIVPYRISRRTNLYEMQVAHVQCNRAKGDRMNLSGYRRGQQAAHLMAVDRIRQLRRGKDVRRCLSIVLPPGYGKSDVIRAVSADLFLSGDIGAALVLAPFALLPEQLVDPASIAPGWKRLGLPPELKLRYINTPPMDDPDAMLANKEYLLATTFGMVKANMPIFLDWIKTMAHRSRPVLILIDEAHYVSEAQTWGSIVTYFLEAGAIGAILFTGTARREDGTTPPGFQTKTLDLEQMERIFYVGPGSLPDTVRLQRRWLMQGNTYLVPDVEVTLAEAWNEDPLPICKASAIWLDPFAEDSGGKQSLSLMSRDEVRTFLPAIVRDPRMIAEAVRFTGQELIRMRAAWPELNPGWLFYCGNDREEDEFANQHARDIKREFQLQYPQVHVDIATMKSEIKAAQLVKAFRHGHGQVLIVKQVGGVGLDAPRIVGATDLSVIRSLAADTQRKLRPGRPWHSADGQRHKEVFTLILPNDALAQDLYDVIFVPAGRASEGQRVTLGSEILDEFEVPKKQGPDDPEFVIQGVEIEANDRAGQHGTAEELAFVQRILTQLPNLEGAVSHAALAAAIRQAQQGPSADPSSGGPESVNTQIEQLKRDINQRAKAITDRRMRRQGPYSQELYAVTSLAVWRDGYRDAGLMQYWHKDQKLGRLTALTDLEKLLGAFARIWAENR
jgi:hypothetical protein